MMSTACSMTRGAISAEPKASILDLLVRAFAAMAREIRLRRDLRSLQSLDDVMLQDIGLGRGELEDAVRHGRSGHS